MTMSQRYASQADGILTRSLWPKKKSFYLPANCRFLQSVESQEVNRGGRLSPEAGHEQPVQVRVPMVPLPLPSVLRREHARHAECPSSPFEQIPK